MKGIGKKKPVIIIAAVFVLFALVYGGYFMFFSGNYVNVKGQKLNRFYMSTGGDMMGGYRKTTVTRQDDQWALMTVESSSGFLKFPTVKEYLIDARYLDEIQALFKKYHMNFWNNKEFSKRFIADGNSYSYSFNFDSDRVYFSSQYYPQKYQSKLQKIEDVLFFYGTELQQLPGLVLDIPESDSEDYTYDGYIPSQGEAAIYVNKYAENRLYFTMVNDTEDKVEYIRKPVIKNLKDGSVVYAAEKERSGGAFAKGRDEQYISLDFRLEAGTYELSTDIYSCTFEIR